MSKEIKSLRIKNGHLETLISFLDIPLHSTDARARNSFITKVGKQIGFLNSEKQRLLTEHAEKDAKGKVKFLEKGARYDITPQNLEKVNVEMGVLYEEKYILDYLPSNKAEIDIVTKIILQSTKEFGVTDGLIYDELCQAVERIK